MACGAFKWEYPGESLLHTIHGYSMIQGAWKSADAYRAEIILSGWKGSTAKMTSGRENEVDESIKAFRSVHFSVMVVSGA